MYILGLHFGHDASVALVRDGNIVAFASRERRSGHKHAAGLSMGEIDHVLETAGIGASDVDLCAVTSTQEMELICPAADELAVIYGEQPAHPMRSPYYDYVIRRYGRMEHILDPGYVLPVLDGSIAVSDEDLAFYRSLFPDWSRQESRWLKSFPSIDELYIGRDWPEMPGFGDILNMPLPESAAGLERVRLSFHYPLTVEIRGRGIPGYFIHHHAAHAASTYYTSRFPDAAVITHDGYPMVHTYNSGFFYLGLREKLYPISPHYLTLGHMYSKVSMKLGLGDSLGGPGKLMGLSSYGVPRFFDKKFLGNDFDLKSRFGRTLTTAESDTWLDWWNHCLAMARDKGYDCSVLADAARITEPVNADIAASTQMLLEEAFLNAAELAKSLLERLDVTTENICLSGGVALNCPSNTRLYNDGPFRNVFVEPCCDDSGLSIGAALNLYHNLLGNEVPPGREGRYFSPFLGSPCKSSEIAAAIEASGDRVQVQLLGADQFVESAARDLAADQIIALFDDGSEVGPRALCHRSILAHPGKLENWQRVNRIKGREMWRPLAPVVLEEHAQKWFQGAPMPSPYMLFNARVTGEGIPAVTHVDGSSRIQTADSSTGAIYRILGRFHELTGLPILLNTSFNGPGQPIVESPRQALDFLLGTTLDALYIDGRRITRRASPG